MSEDLSEARLREVLELAKRAAEHAGSYEVLFRLAASPAFVAALVERALELEKASMPHLCIDCRNPLPEGHPHGYCPARDEPDYF